MRAVFRAVGACLFLLPLLLPRACAENERGDAVRAVWVSTVLGLDYPAAPTRDGDSLARQADEILDRCAAIGFTDIFLQVRPAADAIYPSELFPWSLWLTGRAGQPPQDGFDPLAHWVRGAHDRGLRLHAWINPYRITKNTDTHRITAPDQLPEDSPARLHPEWVISCGGDLYFDPALEEVQALVTAGIRELLDRYPIDGIHLDDYFYPGPDFDDAASYARLGGGLPLDDWRRENVTRLIRRISETVRERPGVVFGISPGGIWANRTTDPRGSATSGGETLTRNYADTRAWVEEGLADYICPQIYWHMGHPAADFKILADWWAALCRDSSVRLYIGLAAYRVNGPGEDPAWQGPDEILRQLDYIHPLPGADGTALFRWGSLAADPALAGAVKNWFSEHPRHMLSVNVPERDLVTDCTAYWIGGTAAPNAPLTVNGVPVENRAAGGAFGLHVPLEVGVNTFSFEQNGVTVCRTITRAEHLPDYDAAGRLSGLFPASELYAFPGQTVELSCTAPLGAAVRADFCGRVFVLTPDRQPSSAATAADTTAYRCRVTLPGRCTALRDLGAPVYTLRRQDVRQIRTGAPVRLIPDGASLTAGMNRTVWGYEAPSLSGGPAGEYSSGMRDNVSAVSGQFLRLASGLWIRAGDAEVSEGCIGGEIRAAVHRASETAECITFAGSAGAAGWAAFDEDVRVLTLRISPTDSAPPLTLNDSRLFSGADAELSDGCAVYRLTLREGVAPGGFSLETEGDRLILTVRQKRNAVPPPYPLRGHTILLDPGHGGSASGALGLSGSALPEKTVNLALTMQLAEKLRSLGASVTETRTEDRDLSLEERTDMTRALRPDLFLSIHCNNLAADADLTDTEGFSVYYREPLSRAAAETLYAVCREITGGPDCGIHRRNFHVCRGSVCPALLFETAFMSHPGDFERLQSAAWRDVITDALAQAVLRYFENP